MWKRLAAVGRNAKADEETRIKAKRNIAREAEARAKAEAKAKAEKCSEERAARAKVRLSAKWGDSEDGGEMSLKPKVKFEDESDDDLEMFDKGSNRWIPV
jgi:outer membrane translocation and assembly module TamA